jgi:hypothetical protein
MEGLVVSDQRHLAMFHMIKAADLNDRIQYNKIEWPVLLQVWIHSEKGSPCSTVEELCQYISPCLKEANLEQTLVLGIFVGSRFLTSWEAILEPMCAPTKALDDSRVCGYCDLLFVVNGRLSLLEFKKHNGSLKRAVREVSGYICIQPTKAKRHVEGRNDGPCRLEPLWVDQSHIDKFALAGNKEKGLVWEHIGSTENKADLLALKVELFSKQ